MSLKETAYHEAGHAVVAYRLNYWGGDLSIEPQENILGSCETEGESPDKKSYKEQIIILYAGLAAELKHNPKAEKGGSKNDNEKAADLLQYVNVTESELRQQAKKLIEENWPVIEAIAEALLVYKTLPEDEWSIIIDAIDEGRNWKADLKKMQDSRNILVNRS